MSTVADIKARQSERITLKGGLKDFALALMVITVLGAAVFVTASRRVAFIEIGYEIRQLEKEERELLHQKHEMEIEKAMLSSPERIEKTARDMLGMKEPEPEQIRILP